jgi:hypothetical protein
MKRFVLAALLTAALMAAAIYPGSYGIVLLFEGKNPLAFTAPTRENAAQSRERGQVIVDAIHRYHKDRGEYPASLDDLVPSQLQVVEQPTVGDRRWTYTRPDTDRFILDFFVGPIYEHERYDSKIGSWKVDH